MSKCKTCNKRRTSRRLRPALMSPISRRQRTALETALESAVEDDEPYTDKERAEDEAARANPGVSTDELLKLNNWIQGLKRCW